MSAEQYANLGSTTLTASYTAGAGSITVGSTTGNFPASAPFRIVIIDQSDQVTVKVIFKVTAITDSTHFAVTAEGTDANAANGDLVKGAILTAAGLDAIRGDMNRVVTGALPSDGRKGDQLNPTDDIVRRVHDGSNFLSFGPAFSLTDPTLQTWAWRNQGGASVTTNAGSIAIVGDAVSGVNLRCRETSAPSTPWTVTACLIPRLLAVNFHGAAIYVRDSVGGKITSIGVNHSSNLPQLQCTNFTSETAFDSFAITSQNVSHFGLLWLRINDDGTNLKYSWGTDGINFLQFHSVGRHGFLAAGPDKVGFCIDSENTTYAAAVSLISWKFT